MTDGAYILEYFLKAKYVWRWYNHFLYLFRYLNIFYSVIALLPYFYTHHFGDASVNTFHYTRKCCDLVLQNKLFTLFTHGQTYQN